ncbi:FAD binding domain-containing protein [Ditylenchus destructor]|nr:FAD binding domain-containing protein [Ditylenchus destructor]
MRTNFKMGIKAEDSQGRTKDTITSDVTTLLLPLLFVFGFFAFAQVGSSLYVITGILGGFHSVAEWFLPHSTPPIRLSNWGGNFQYSTQNIQYPRTPNEVQSIVKAAKGRMRVLGTRHSFSTIADSADTIICTTHLNRILGLDPSIPSVTVEPGITYTGLVPFLDTIGFALPNLASSAEITVGGASQTGAHGSGITLGSLATQIRSLKMVLANGSFATFGPENPELKAVALGLGVFGVITQVELMIQPSFKTINHVFFNMPQENVYRHFNQIQNSGYAVQLFTDFSNLSSWNQVWVNVKSDNNTMVDQQNFFGAVKGNSQISPIAALPGRYVMEYYKEQPWYYGMLDYRLGLSGSNGDEIQTEWFLPYQNAVPAIKAVSKLGAKIAPDLYTMLVRSIDADDLWMSPQYQGRSVSLHFSWKPNPTTVMEHVRKIEEAINPYKARPHWGKIHTMRPNDFLQHYPKLKDFRKLADKLDPEGKFRNAFIEENVFVDNMSL